MYTNLFNLEFKGIFPMLAEWTLIRLNDCSNSLDFIETKISLQISLQILFLPAPSDTAPKGKRSKPRTEKGMFMNRFIKLHQVKRSPAIQMHVDLL